MARRPYVLGLVAVTIAGGGGYALRARAGGIPPTNALSYVGVAANASGPLTGSHNIQVALYDAALAGDLLCQTTSTPVTLAAGRFAVQLPSSCVTAIGANATTWVDVVVDGQDTGRTMVEAVPYAVEANHAVSADNASTTGTLAQAVVPSGAVMAFNLSACPTGWTAYSAAGGRTIIGVNATGGNGLSAYTLGQTVGEETHTMSVGEIAAHSHTLEINLEGSGPNEGYWNFSWSAAGVVGSQSATPATLGGGLQNFMTVETTGSTTPFNQLQPSIALLYCQKS
jgi:hypothetical protein